MVANRDEVGDVEMYYQVIADCLGFLSFYC